MRTANALLKMTLLSATLLLGRAAHAQDGDTKPPYPYNLLMSPAYGGMSAANARAMPYATQHEIATPSRVGLLFIRGPEHDTSVYKPNAMKEPDAFKQRFKDIPVRVIGNGVDSINTDSVLAALDELAEEDIDEIVMINGMHAGKMKDIKDAKPPYVMIKPRQYYTQAGMQCKSDGSYFTSDSLYKSVGRRWETNGKLGGKHLRVLDMVCYGECSFNAYHFLPLGTDIAYYSSTENPTYYDPGNNAFARAYDTLVATAARQQRPEPKMDGRTAFVTQFMAANGSLWYPRNHMRLMRIVPGAPDTLRDGGEKFYFGTHKAIVIRPSDIVGDVLNTFSDKQIREDLKEFDDIVTPEERQKAINAFRANIFRDWMPEMDVKTTDRLTFIAAAMAMKYDMFHHKSLDYGLSKEVKAAGWFTPKPRVNESTQTP